MSKIRLSFIIPVYQVAEYLGQCLASVSAQRLEDLEAWVIDDGSTDGSAEICDEWAGRDPRFHVVHTPNQGVSVARNLGMERASGEWICFVDGDDWIERDFTERLSFDHYGDADIVLFGYSVVNARGKVRYRRNITKADSQPEIDVDYIVSRKLSPYTTRQDAMLDDMNFSNPWGRMYRAEFLEKNHLRYTPGLLMGEDTVLNLDALFRGARVYRSAVMEYCYRENKSSMSHRYTNAIAIAYQRRAHELERVLLNHHRMSDFREQYNSVFIGNLQQCAALDYCHPDNPLPFSQRRAGFLELRNSPDYDTAFQNADFSSMGYKARFVLSLMQRKDFLAVDIYYKLRYLYRLFKSYFL